MTNKRWNYVGDVNIRHGGYFWQESGCDDHVYAVRVTPCSDAGGPDNLFQIEHDGSIYIGNDPTRIASALECIGATLETATRAQIVDAMLCYAGVDDAAQCIVRIGKPSDNGGGWNPEPNVVLRGNASLRRYVRREFLN